MKVSNTNLAACLNISIDFLLQDNSLEELNNFKDHNGYTLLHWAVLNNDAKKVDELLSLNFQLSNSFNNFIPDLPIDVSKSTLDSIPNLMIHFNETGYSPLHLCVYLFNLYQIQNSHKFSTYTTDQQTIFSLFFKYNDNSYILDNDGYTYMDYCFILENTVLMFLLDKPLETNIDILKKVTLETALKIMDRLKNKVTLENDNYSKKLQLLFDEIERKIVHNYLENTIPNKHKSVKLKKI